MDGVRGHSRDLPDDLWRPPTAAPDRGTGNGAEPEAEEESGSGDHGQAVRFPQQRLAPPRPPTPPRTPRQSRQPRQSRPSRAPQPSRAPLYGSPLGPLESGRVNEDLDLDDLDPRGAAQRRAVAKAALATRPRRRRSQAFRITSGICAVIVLVVAALGMYAYHHLFGQVATENLDALTDRPAASRADQWGNVPLNLLLLGSQTRDGQHGSHLGNSSKLGTDISDTAMLVHINAERKWATVVSIPRDLIVPRPQCPGRLDPAQTVPAARAAMFDLAMNLGGPTCAVATVEQMTGIRIDHFVEITFNAFQDLTDAVGGVTVCVPPPGINDPDYSGLVLGPGLHTVSGAQSLAFVRDRHGLADGTDLNRIRMQQMFVSSLFNKLAEAGTLGNPITLYRIVNAVTSNLTVDTGLDSIDAMVGLAGSVQSLQSHYLQFLTVPYAFDPANRNRVLPGPGFDQVWTDLRQDTPLPGSNAARAFGTARRVAAASPVPAATVPLTGTEVAVYNSTRIAHLALYAAQNLRALGMQARVGQGSPIGAVARTRLLYPTGLGAQAANLAARFDRSGQIQTVRSGSVKELTLVIGADAPTALVAVPDGNAGPGAGSAPPDAGSGSASPGSDSSSGPATDASPSPGGSISAESRSGDENICSDLPNTVSFGGKP
jgi:LCP family protein required for cell wall assembly